MDAAQLERVVGMLAPEDDGFVAYCDLHVNGRGPYRLQSTRRVVDELLRRVRDRKVPLRIREYGLTITHADTVIVTAVAFTDAERAAYTAATRAYWSAPAKDGSYPGPPPRLAAEHAAILAARNAGR